jgi:hypothetical protein
MLCHRCRGLLVRETFGDLREEAGCMSPATRCINCGYIEDSVVRTNRLHPPGAKRVALRGMVGRGGVLFKGGGAMTAFSRTIHRTGAKSPLVKRGGL